MVGDVRNENRWGMEDVEIGRIYGEWQEMLGIVGDVGNGRLCWGWKDMLGIVGDVGNDRGCWKW